MGRKKDKGGGDSGAPGWMVTFSDLVTLLLTFFVLLLTMSSMDRTVLTKINFFTKSVSQLSPQGRGRVPTDVKLLIELLERPWEVVLKQKTLKDLLFPDDILPMEIDRNTLENNLEIMERPEGVALVLTDKLLFRTGSAELTPAAVTLLNRVAEVFIYSPADINVAGFTDNVGNMTSNLDLSARRAYSVLATLTEAGVPERRFSTSAYGPNWPLAENTTEAGRARNRRVEILLKTQPWLSGYS